MQNIRNHSFSKCDLALSRKVSPAAFILGDLTHIKVMISKKNYQNVAHFFTLKYLQLKLDWAKNTRKWTWQIRYVTLPGENMRRFPEMVLREDLKKERTYKILQLLRKWTGNVSSRCEKGWTFVEKHRNENKEPFVFKSCQKHFHWFWQPLEGKVLTNPMLRLTKRCKRSKESRGAGVWQSHWWGQQRGTAERQHQEESAVRSIINVSHSMVFLKICFLRNSEIILNSLFFCFLIGEWLKGPHSIPSRHSKSK